MLARAMKYEIFVKLLSECELTNETSFFFSLVDRQQNGVKLFPAVAALLDKS